MKLSVIIVSYNTCDLLKKCLEYLFRYPGEAPLEVFVVDNASRDDSAAMVRTCFPDIHLIENTLGADLGSGCRRGQQRSEQRVGYGLCAQRLLLRQHQNRQRSFPVKSG